MSKYDILFESLTEGVSRGLKNLASAIHNGQYESQMKEKSFRDSAIKILDEESRRLRSIKESMTERLHGREAEKVASLLEKLENVMDDLRGTLGRSSGPAAAAFKKFDKEFDKFFDVATDEVEA